MNELFLEPLKYYETEAKNKITENAESYFDDILKKSGIDEEENRKTVEKYRKENENIKNLNSKISKFKALRVLLILLAVVGIILFFVGVFRLAAASLSGIAFLLIGISLVALCIYFWFGKINKTIKNFASVRDEHSKKADEYMKTALKQTALLNALFDNTDTFKIIEKTIPEIKFNPLYTKEHEKLLTTHYDFEPFNDPNISVTDVLSGTLLSNPFLFYRYKKHTMGSHTYIGSLTISWTETYTDSEGKRRTRVRTQTLTASLTKPKPFYTTHTSLGFGAQASPNLCFDRSPTHAEKMSEKSLERKVSQGAKKLEKQARKATAHGENFQEMANVQFDVLFGARNRNNEVEFRVMYTPLAQRNTTDLMKSTLGYGDDFHFEKRKRFNIISSEHSAAWNMNTSPSNYHSYDVDEVKKKFISFNSQYFKSIYFDFAPLMSIPAYMEEPSFSMEKPNEQANYYTTYEHEVLANAIGTRAFEAQNFSTDAILKTSLVKANAGSDILKVSAYSYKAFDRVDFVPRLGGDGRMHAVPVHWVEYIPQEAVVDMSIKNLNMSENEFACSDIKPDSDKKWAFRHGIMATII